MKVLIDANLVLRLMIPEEKNAKQYLQAKEFWQKISQGKITGVLSIATILEVFWVAESFYQIKRIEYAQDLLSLCEYKNIEILELPKKLLFEILATYKMTKIDLVDIYLAIMSEAKKMQVASFDQNLMKLKTSLYKF